MERSGGEQEREGLQLPSWPPHISSSPLEHRHIQFTVQSPAVHTIFLQLMQPLYSVLRTLQCNPTSSGCVILTLRFARALREYQ